jgi:hypothetical protein
MTHKIKNLEGNKVHEYKIGKVNVALADRLRKDFYIFSRWLKVSESSKMITIY